jgi:hypothetical protein
MSSLPASTASPFRPPYCILDMEDETEKVNIAACRVIPMSTCVRTDYQWTALSAGYISPTHLTSLTTTVKSLPYFNINQQQPPRAPIVAKATKGLLFRNYLKSHLKPTYLL